MPQPNTTTLLDRFTGSMLGLAVGDALGFPVEFIKRAQILHYFGPQGVTGFTGSRTHPPGTFSDDTQMTLALAHGLLQAGPQASLNARMSAIADEFVAWAQSPANNRAPGNTCMRGCHNLARGVPWSVAGVPESKGCGSAMRVAPIGLLYHDDLDTVADVARASSLHTHGHPAAIESAAAAALMVALAVRDVHPAAMLAELQARCGGRSPDLDQRLAQVPTLIHTEPALALAHDGLGEAWVAEEAVASALYCAWRHPDDYSACVLEAANTDGDSDSIATIAGSILGARLGVHAIPAQWAADVEDAAALRDLARRLHDARHTTP